MCTWGGGIPPFCSSAANHTSSHNITFFFFFSLFKMLSIFFARIWFVFKLLFFWCVVPTCNDSSLSLSLSRYLLYMCVCVRSGAYVEGLDLAAHLSGTPWWLAPLSLLYIRQTSLTLYREEEEEENKNNIPELISILMFPPLFFFKFFLYLFLLLLHTHTHTPHLSFPLLLLSLTDCASVCFHHLSLSLAHITVFFESNNIHSPWSYNNWISRAN